MPATWPKRITPLTTEQQDAREKWMKLWHEVLPSRYGVIEKFNHGFPANLPHPAGCRTLEVGAGLGEHFSWEKTDQDYYCLEYRQKFCDQMKAKVPAERIICGDIHTRQPFPHESFDRVIAIHVLEHLPNLPAALKEIRRLLKADGSLDIVIPCEGGWAYELARTISSRRLFEKTFKMPYMPIAKAEHVNTCWEIAEALAVEGFRTERSSYFPLQIPVFTMNLCVGMRLKKATSARS
jgi:SAM-dependent methyltransferase